MSLELWHYYNGPQKEVLDRLVTEFNQTAGMEKGIVVEASSQGNVNDLIRKVMNSANKKVGADPIPDIFAAYADTAYAIDRIGLAADLDPYFTEEELRYLIRAGVDYLQGYLLGRPARIPAVALHEEIIRMIRDAQAGRDPCA